MKVRMSLLTLAALSLGLLSDSGMGQRGNNLYRQELSVLHSKSERAEITDAVSSIEGKQRELIEDLIRIAAREETPEASRVASVYLLGKIRASSAVAMLIKLLEFGEVDINPELPEYGVNPPVEALVRIGKPSVRPLLHLLEQGDSPKRESLALAALIEIEGPLLPRLLEVALGELQDARKRQRLESVLGRLRGP